MKLDLWCIMREMVISAQTWRGPVEGVREGNRFFVDPLWDPLRYALNNPLSVTDLERIRRVNKHADELVERLIALERSSEESER